MASPQPVPASDSVFDEYWRRLSGLIERANEARAILERRNDRLFGVDAETMSQDGPGALAAGLSVGMAPLLTEMDNALNMLSESLFLLRHQIDRQSPLG